MATVETVLLDANSRHRKYTGASKFHAAGYYGERVVAATGESWSLNSYNPGGLVLDPLNRGIGAASHPISTAAVFFQFAPKTKLVMLNMGACISSDPSKVYVRFADESLPIIKEYGILNQFCSFTQSTSKLTDQIYQEAMDQIPDFKLWWAMGNDDDDSYNRITDLECMYGVGAYKIMVDGQIVPEGFSSESTTVDFCAPDMIYINTSATSPDATAGPHSGTSFSAPTLCAMSCLVDDFFIDKTGKPLSREMMYQFFLDHCEDLDAEGFDVETGHGAVRLPDPAEIDIEKYATYSSDTPVVDPPKEDEPEEENPVKTTENKPENYKEIQTVTSDNVQVTRVPYIAIAEVGFAKCNEPTESVTSWYNRQEDKPQIVTNGGLFNMSSGTNILSFIEDGVEQNYSGNFEGMGVKYDNTALLQPGSDTDGDWKDFMSAYPVLVRDGKAVYDYDKGDEINYKAARTAVGVAEDGSLIIITVDRPGVKFEELSDLFVANGAWFAMNLDGGGSVYKMLFGEVANDPTESRKIDNVFYVKLKEVNDMSENTAVDLNPFTIEPGIYYAVKSIEFKAGIDSSADEPSKVLGTIVKGDQVEVFGTNEWNGQLWAPVEWNYQRGYIVCTEDNLTNVAPLPAIYRVLADEGDLKAKDKVIVDHIDDDTGMYRAAAKAQIDDPNDISTFYAVQIPDVMVDPSNLEYVCGYYGTLLPDEEEEEPDMPVTPGEGGGEGDEPKDPDVDDDLFPAIYAVNPEMVNSVLNVRTEPSTSSEIIGTMDPGTEIVVDAIEDGWAKFIYNGETAYCSAGYLIYVGEEEEEPETPVEPDEPETPAEPEEPVKIDSIPMQSVIGIIIEATDALEAGDIVWIKSAENGIAKIVNNLCENCVPTEVSMDNLSVVGMIGSLNEEDPSEPGEPDTPEEPDPEEGKEPTDEELLAQYTDSDQISDVHMNGVLFALEAGLLVGRTNDTLCPKDSLTREEAATMFYRFACLEAGLNPDDKDDDDEGKLIEIPIE